MSRLILVIAGLLVSSVALALPVAGEKKVLVVIVQFANQSSPPTTKEKVLQALLTNKDSTNEVFKESSGGKLSFKSVTVIGPYKIAATSKGCSPGLWTSQARAMAEAQGYSFLRSAYDLSTYVSSGGGCGYKGQAVVGGIWSWVSGAAAGYWSHELGHSLGFNHSGGALGSTYGDNSDPIGGTSNALFSGPNRALAGWLAPTAVADVKTSGEYTLAPVQTLNPALQVLKIPNPAGGAYYVSWRQAIGRDALLAESYRDVVMVRSSKSASGDADIVIRAKLKPGQAYTDNAASIRVTALDVKEGAAKVRIETTGSKCVPAIPLVTFAQPTVAGRVGEPVTVQATVRNRNPATCLSSDINVASSGPAGSTYSVPSKTVHIAPGETTTVPLLVVASKTGAHRMSVRAWNSGGTPSTAYVTLTASEEPAEIPKPPVVSPETVAPPAPATGAAVLGASADTYLSEYHKSLPWGTAQRLHDQGSGYSILVRFAVFQSQGGPVPDGAPITSATLALHKYSPYNATYKLLRIAEDWSEKSATWATAPKLSGDVDATATVGWEPGWIEFDVKNALHDVRYGWMLEFAGGNRTGGKKFDSREAKDAALRPRLTVEWR